MSQLAALGINIYGALTKQSLSDLEGASALVDTVESDSSGAVQKNILKLASGIFKAANMGDTVGCKFLDNLVDVDNTYGTLNAPSEIVLDVLLKEAFIKEAANPVTAALGKILAGLSTGGHGIVLGGLGIGGLGGAATWYLDRDIKKENAEIMLLKEKKKEYERIAKEIEAKLENHYAQNFNEVVDHD